jgi:hypothetical protein
MGTRQIHSEIVLSEPGVGPVLGELCEAGQGRTAKIGVRVLRIDHVGHRHYVISVIDTLGLLSEQARARIPCVDGCETQSWVLEGPGGGLLHVLKLCLISIHSLTYLSIPIIQEWSGGSPTTPGSSPQQPPTFASLPRHSPRFATLGFPIVTPNHSIRYLNFEFNNYLPHQ